MKMKTKIIANTLLVLSCIIVILSIQASYSISTKSPHAGDTGVKTQLCMILDGSGSIYSTDWNTIKQGIAKAINSTLPHDGSVELTIIQFGYSTVSAKTEIPPTIIDNASYITVANKILTINQSSGGTPMAHGLYLGWKEISSSPNFATAAKQVINLATDGGPNERNNNATSDLDGDTYTDYYDDVIAVVNNAVSQGLDELDMEGIAISNSSRDWFKNWVVRPQPGILAPPFSKQGWIRVVADATEFANTIAQKLQMVIVQEESSTWAPSAEGALVAAALTVSVTSGVSAVASAVSNPEGCPSNKLAEKANDILPDSVKKWLDSFICSKTGASIEHRVSFALFFTKQEILSIAISLAVVTFAFSYAKTENLNQILSLMPIVLVTAIIIDFAKDLVREVVARSLGVWSEYRLWYFGLAMFLISSIAFKVPFSSPNRIRHNSPNLTTRKVGILSLTAIVVPLIFAGFFYMLFVNGFTLIGNMGLIICLTAAFFDTIPIPPMNGKDIYDWSKVLWLALFIPCFALYALCLLLL